MVLYLFLSALVVPFFRSAQAYDPTCYWGQNSFGAAGGAASDSQQRLAFYCGDATTDAFPVAFLNVFFGPGNAPELNLANTCSTVNDTVFDGTELINCSFLASDIQTCQKAGKIVTLSIGGATGGGTFSNDDQAQGFADEIWNMFLGGSSDMRPFGDAVLDGVDLDIEGGSQSYVPFVNQLRSHMDGASKTYYITAAPQCVFPDANIGATLSAVGFDAVYVQLYNNPCGLTHYNDGTYTWNFAVWDYWATNVSPNKDVKVFIGAPASSTAAGSGYVSIDTLQAIAEDTRKNFPSFGGVMLWDASQAYANDRYDQGIKSSMKSNGSCGRAFAPQPCTAEAFDSSANYPMGSTVSYGGYQWVARYYGSGTPKGDDDSGSWRALFACSGSAPANSTSTTTTTVPAATSSTAHTHTANTTPTAATVTATSETGTVPGTTTLVVTTTYSLPVSTISIATQSATSTATSNSGTCSGVAAWSPQTAYASPVQCTYNGQLWQANQWNYNEVPGGVAEAWTLVGSCAALGNRLAQKPLGAGTCTLKRSANGVALAQPTSRHKKRRSLRFRFPWFN
ncbi:Chitinase 1 [Tulasnella sp. JGI-2019a]|nr:Chitinase 1 [Tulasnella sp. JGI-2019a]